MKNVLIIDDERPIELFSPYAKPTIDDFILLASKPDTALKTLYWPNVWDEVYLDHDLGDEIIDGTFLVNAIEANIEVNNQWPYVKKFFVHSGNPVGAQRMVSVLAKYFSVERIFVQ